MSQVPDIVDEPEEQEVSTSLEITGHVSVRSGPIPTPEVLGQYEEVLPGSADRIMSMAENQQGHRHRMEELQLRTPIQTMKFGTLMWGAFLLSTLAAGTLLLYTEKNIPVGAGVLFLPLVTVAVGYLKRIFSSHGQNGNNGAEPAVGP